MRDMLMLKRRKAKLSQKELGERLGVSGQTISEWERGNRLPSLTPRQTSDLCRALSVSLDELVVLFDEVD
ncbi:MAG TPA: helix-turn-helix transcriptional regulator [Stenomitos sp.]